MGKLAVFALVFTILLDVQLLDSYGVMDYHPYCYTPANIIAHTDYCDVQWTPPPALDITSQTTEEVKSLMRQGLKVKWTSPTPANEAYADYRGYVVRADGEYSAIRDLPLLVAWIELEYETTWVNYTEIRVIEDDSRAGQTVFLCLPVGEDVDPNYTTYMTSYGTVVGSTLRLREDAGGFFRGDTFVYFENVGSDMRMYSFRRDETLVVTLPKGLFDASGFYNPTIYEYIDENGQIIGKYGEELSAWPYPNNFDPQPVAVGGVSSRYSRRFCRCSWTFDFTITYDKFGDGPVHSLPRPSAPIDPNVEMVTPASGYHYAELLITDDTRKYARGRWVYYTFGDFPLQNLLVSSTMTRDYSVLNQDVQFTQTHTATESVYMGFCVATLDVPCQFNNGENASLAKQIIYTAKFTTAKLHKGLGIIWDVQHIEVVLAFVPVLPMNPITGLTLTSSPVSPIALIYTNEIPSPPQISVLVKTLSGGPYTCKGVMDYRLLDFSDPLEDVHNWFQLPSVTNIVHNLPITSNIPVELAMGHNVFSYNCSNILGWMANEVDILVVGAITDFELYMDTTKQAYMYDEIVLGFSLTYGSDVNITVSYDDIVCYDGPTGLQGVDLVNVAWTTNCPVPESYVTRNNQQVLVKATAYNEGSSHTLELNVSIFTTIENVTLTLKSKDTALNSLVDGLGPNKDQFRPSMPLAMIGTYDYLDNSLNYTWSIQCTVTVDVPLPVGLVTEIWLPTPAQECTITLLVFHSVHEVETSMTISVAPSLVFNSITNDGPSVMGDPMTFTIDLGLFGVATCLWFNPDDGSALYLFESGLDLCAQSRIENETDWTVPAQLTSNAVDYDATTIVFSHVYAVNGTYQGELYGYDPYDTVSIEETVVVVDLLCSYPNVTITGLTPHQNPLETEHYRSEVLSLGIEEEINCEKTDVTVNEWFVSKLDVDPRSTAQPWASLPATPYSLGSNITINGITFKAPARTLVYGFYKITARLHMQGLYDVFGEYSIIVHIVQTPWLEPSIVGGQFVRIIFEEQVTLDASTTIDPDWEDISGLSYSWYCKDMDDDYVFNSTTRLEDEPRLYIPNINDSNTILPPTTEEINTVTGCFNTGRGRLNTTSPQLLMETMFMLEGKIYDIFLVTVSTHPEFGVRQAMVQIYFEVALGKPPLMEIRCGKNCREKVVPDGKLILEAVCLARCDGELTFTWTLFQYGDYYEREPRDLNATLSSFTDVQLADMITNPTTELFLAFKKNTFPGKTKYCLRMVAARPSGNYGEDRHTIRVNSSPTGGTCSIFPPSGTAFDTDFVFSCDGWEDEDLPLKYSFIANYGGIQVPVATMTSTAYSASVSAWLPIGDSSNGRVIDIVAKITDQYLAGVTVNLSVRVEPPTKENANISKIKDRVETLFKKYADEGKRKETFSLLLIVSSLVDYFIGPEVGENSPVGNSSNTTSEVSEMFNATMQLKAACLTAFTNMDTSDPDDILESAGAFAMISAGSSFPFDFLEPLSHEANALTKTFVTFSRNDGLISDVNLIGNSLLTIISNNIRSLSQFDTDEAAELILLHINMTGLIQAELLSCIVANGDPLTLDSKSLSVYVKKETLANFGANATAVKGSNVEFPGVEAFGLGDVLNDVNATFDQLQSVDTKIMVSLFNPYTRSNTSKTVTSNIVDLKLSCSLNITTSNLTSEIEMTIKRDPDLITETAYYMKPTPSHNDSGSPEFLKYHCFNRTNQWTGVNIEIAPHDANFAATVYLNPGGHPNIKEHKYTATFKLPNFEYCDLTHANESQGNESIPVDPNTHCKVHPYKIVISNEDFTELGKHCIGVHAVEFREDAPSRQKRSFSCDVGKRRMRRSCVIIPDPPPPPPTVSPIEITVADNLGFDGQFFFPNQTPNYNLTMFESSCLYYDEVNDTWTGIGCRMGIGTTRSGIQCFCNHMTSFGSDLLVAPNPIDFDQAFANFGSLSDNVAVLALISCILGFYILGVIWARRADKRDDLMTGPTILRKPQGTYRYLITVYTGNRLQSGTTAKVFLKMSGEDGETLPVKLYDRHRPCYGRGQENAFVVSYPEGIGEINLVEIWHDNKGDSPSWYLSRLNVRDLQTEQQWYFICDNWLAVESADGQVCRTLPCATEQDMVGFHQLFAARTVKGLVDGHLWFSVFSRPPGSNFTRVQRMSCCLCLLCCTMITSAMFYNTGGQSGPSPFTIYIGSLAIDLKQFIVGLQSSIIIIPVNVLLVQIYRNLKPKPVKEDKSDDNEGGDLDQVIAKENQRKAGKDAKSSSDAPPDGKLPYWFNYIAYALCYLTSLACIFFTLLYSIQWGKTVSTEWVVCMVTAFFQSVLLLQPIKVVVMAVIFATVIRKPADSDDAPLEVPEPSPQPRKIKKNKKQKIYSPPDPETLLQARIKRLKEIRMNEILMEIATFFIFLWMLMNVANCHRDPDAFLLTKTLYETFDEVDAFAIDFDAVSDGDSLWMWARETLIPGLYSSEWYNGKEIEKGWIANNEDLLVGVPRVRLLRIEKDSCDVDDKYFKDIIPHCYDSYSMSEEETGDYNVGWEPLEPEPASRKRRSVWATPETEKEWFDMMSAGGSMDNVAARHKRAVDPIMSAASGRNRRKKKRLRTSSSPKVYKIEDSALLPDGKVRSCLERWRHQDTLELRGFPYWGNLALYSGGGYAANLGYDQIKAYTVVSDLHSNGWVEVQSRAVLVEFTVYNANTNLFGMISMFIEFPASAGAHVSAEFEASRFYLHLSFMETISHVMVFFFMIYFLYREGKLMKKQRCAYFKGFWNWIETILIVCEFLTVVLFLARLFEVDRNLIQFHQNPNDYVGFQYAGSTDALFRAVLGLLVFFYNIRFMRLLRFNKTFLVLGKIMARISVPIVSFFIPFFFGFFAFGLFAFQVFGNELLDYSSFTMTMVTQFSMTLGDFDFEALVMVNPVIGPLYFIAFIGLNMFVLMNIFIAIINDSYAEIQEEEADAVNEYEVMEYVKERVKYHITPKAKRNRVRPIKKVVRKVEPKPVPVYITAEESEHNKVLSSLESCDDRLGQLLDVIDDYISENDSNTKAMVAVPEDKRDDMYYRVLLVAQMVEDEDEDDSEYDSSEEEEEKDGEDGSDCGSDQE